MFSALVSEVAGLDDGGVRARLRSVEQRRRELAAEEAALLAEADRRKLNAADGHASMWGMLRAELGWSDGECRARMRVARLAAEFHDAGDSLLRGEASIANVAEIARGFANPRCGDRIDEVIGLLLNSAANLEHDDLRRLVRRWELINDVDGAHHEFDAADEPRNAHVGVFDGVGHVAAQFGAADGAEATEIFERFCDAEFRADWEAATAQHGDGVAKSLLARTDAQRRADALMAISAQRPLRRPTPDCPNRRSTC